MIKPVFVFMLVLALGWTTVVPRVTPIVTHAPLIFKINLDLAPKDRYKEVF